VLSARCVVPLYDLPVPAVGDVGDGLSGDIIERGVVRAGVPRAGKGLHHPVLPPLGQSPDEHFHRADVATHHDDLGVDGFGQVDGGGHVTRVAFPRLLGRFQVAPVRPATGVDLPHRERLAALHLTAPGNAASGDRFHIGAGAVGHDPDVGDFLAPLCDEGHCFVGQFVAAVFSFLGRDGTAATAMSTLALLWLVTGLIMYRGRPAPRSACS
jgi:hypothetical protein